MGFDRYRCVLDRIFPFSKLPEYRRRFRFRKYRTAFVSDEKKYDQALEDFNMAIKLNPGYAEAYFNMSGVEYFLGRKDEACGHLLKAVNLGFKNAKETYSKFCGENNSLK